MTGYWIAQLADGCQDNGKPKDDIDDDHDHGFGDPHYHKWDSTGRGKGNSF